MRRYLALLLILGALVGGAAGFAAPGAQTSIRTSSRGVAANRAPIAPGLTFMTPSLHTQSASVTALYAGDDGADPGEIIAKRIVVTGDVDGGYYRSCVKNEASRFRKLIGNMSAPDGSNRAEIYVEGKRKMIDGFVRWCQRGDVGLSQAITVESVEEEDPTGLLDDFYVMTGR